ncbi:hypothetical protein BKA64DRAFT_743766 [Cadophora sp. MPI-SDFR-AT-0126]|nr:hypothetical protein BKA64DRAFT_743766 [Leotiomycetes sp. MPI-SDFR-AT-0126]
MAKSVLLFGATGYIGAAFLSRFNNVHLVGASPQYKVTASIRSPEKARRLKDLLPNVETTGIALGDGIKLEHEVEKCDIIVQLADCDAFDGTQSILKGMKARKDKTGQPPRLYHASGGAFLFSEERNGYQNGTVVSDLDSEFINAIPLSKPHRDVDNSIVQADDAGDINSFIIVPFAVYGTGTGLLHEQIFGNQTSMPVPRLVHVSVEKGAVGQIGPGENPWMVSHVDDGLLHPTSIVVLGQRYMNLFLKLFSVAGLFMALFEDTTRGHGKDGFYFADGDSVAAAKVFMAMAETLYSMGLSEESSPTIHTEEELKKYKIDFWGASVHVRGDRAKCTGWKAQHGVDEFESYVITETKRLAVQPLDSYGRLLHYSN